MKRPIAVHNLRGVLAVALASLAAMLVMQGARAADALRTQVAEMRTTVDELTAERERTHQEGHDVARRLSETQQRVEKLQGVLQQRDALIQTAAAERAGRGTLPFVTYDIRQAQAARSLGWTVLGR